MGVRLFTYVDTYVYTFLDVQNTAIRTLTAVAFDKDVEMWLACELRGKLSPAGGERKPTRV